MKSHKWDGTERRLSKRTDSDSFMELTKYFRSKGYDTEDSMFMASAHLENGVSLAQCQRGVCNICPDAEQRYNVQLQCM